MVCPTCNAIVLEGKRFCTNCGTALPIRCPACGEPQAPGARFCGDCGAGLDPLAGAAAAMPRALPAIPVQPRAAPCEAERRQLTVMFCDLVGSTALSERLDPEDLGKVIGIFFATCCTVIKDFGGSVAEFLGDGVLVFFGHPQAHEDDAERAVQAGLRIVEAVGRLRLLGTALQVRIGIATGLVVVGDLVDVGVWRGQSVVGETPNLAARLQMIAEPGTVVIADSTHRLIGRLFQCIDLGCRPLKGFSEPQRAWRVVGDTRMENRFDALHGDGLNPVVGRDREITLLLDLWARAEAGQGQVVLLAGEPGIGKSRIIRALRDGLRERPHITVGCYCSPYHQDSAFYPVIRHLERAARFARDDDPERKLAKLEALLARSDPCYPDIVPLFAALLSIPCGERHPPLDLGPERQKEKTVAALLANFAASTARCPVLTIFEDIQWIDPTTRDLLGLVIDRVRTLPVLVAITLRPEVVPPWHDLPHLTLLTLDRLGRRHSAGLIERLTRGKALPPEVLEQIVSRADGVPLFLEELTKAVLESGLLHDRGDRYVLAGPLPPLAIPSTLHDSLLARLDRLSPVRKVAQIGAVIGREFSYELLAALAPLPEGGLQLALSQLVEAKLVFQHGEPPTATYIFKHALVQDAAYESLLRSRRQQLHAAIAALLEERFPETAATQPDLLAHHATQAGLAEKAADYWLKAGQMAIARSAMSEAIAQLRKGLAVLEELPDGLDRRRRELGLQVTLGGALRPAKGVSAPETRQAYARACALARQVGDTPLIFPALYGQFIVHIVCGELVLARDVAEELLHLAERQGDATALPLGHCALGMWAFNIGDLAAARTHLERGLALEGPPRRLPSASGSSGFTYAADPRVLNLSFLCNALVLLGYPEQALARCGEAIAEAREPRHTDNTRVLALGNTCCLHQVRRDWPSVREQAEAVLAIANRSGFVSWINIGRFFQGWALAESGQTDAGIAAMRQGLAGRLAAESAWEIPYFLGIMAEAEGRLGHRDEALKLLDDALARAERTGERWFEAELHRLKGEVLLALPEADHAAAEAGFRQALAVARRQQAKLWELRAATSLAGLWAARGKRSEAVRLLAPVCDGFTEGRDLADRKAAQALLDRLG